MTASERDRADGVRVALIGPDLAQRRHLRALLAGHGVDIVSEARLASFSRAQAQGVDVLLVSLEGADDADLDALDRVADERDEPMVFFEAMVLDAATVRGIVRKIEAAALESRRAGGPSKPRALRPLPASGDGRFPVWVLGASFGGPEALTRFLGELPPAPDAAFIIAQHIGDGFAEVLAQQLHRASPVPVVCAAPGMPLHAGRVYVAPIRHRLVIDGRGRFQQGELYGDRSTYTPCIDAIMFEVAARYAHRAAAVVFSGMGDDGARGVRAVRDAGGRVWAQDAGSCAIDSMPNEAAATGTVDRRGPPECLARWLAGELDTDNRGAADKTA